MCGEQRVGRHGIGKGDGSPPRVRGTVFSNTHQNGPPRITPACAGNSYSSSSHIFLLTDHPRVCGEQSPPSKKLKCKKGSPPRVRGTDDLGVVLSEEDGITPACAGNSYLSLLCK